MTTVEEASKALEAAAETLNHAQVDLHVAENRWRDAYDVYLTALMEEK